MDVAGSQGRHTGRGERDGGAARGRGEWRVGAGKRGGGKREVERNERRAARGRGEWQVGAGKRGGGQREGEGNEMGAARGERREQNPETLAKYIKYN
ncbi:hypothetical protein ACLOJK_012670 [Asimina triloba]